MNLAISALYLAIHVLGLVLVFFYYRGTRALVPGAAAFLLAIAAYAVEFVTPRDLGHTDRWPGAAWLDLLMVGSCLGMLGDFCLLGLILSLASPLGHGNPKIEIWVANPFGIASLLCFFVGVAFSPWIAMQWIAPLSTVCYLLAGWGLLRRFGNTPLGLAAAIAFLAEGLAVAVTILLAFAPAESASIARLLLRTVGLVVWPLFLALLAVSHRNPQLRDASARSTLSRDYAELRWAILILAGLCFWTFYEVLTGGPVASHFVWARIPLPWILLLICWSGTAFWLTFVFDHAAAQAPPKAGASPLS